MFFVVVWFCFGVVVGFLLLFWFDLFFFFWHVWGFLLLLFFMVFLKVCLLVLITIW